MKICIDAGHGMSNKTLGVFDSGAVGGGVFEADMTLWYALALKSALSSLGVAVFLTREDDKTPCPVRYRAGVAAKMGCTVFVSIHFNADNGGATGSETLYRDAAKDAPLAKALQAVLHHATGLADRGVKQRTDLAVLKFAAGPAVLLELGFIDNAKDRDKMASKAMRDNVCAALAKALFTHLGGHVPAHPALYQPPHSVRKRLGEIAALATGAREIQSELKGLAHMGLIELRNSVLYIESDMDLDTDGRRVPGVAYESTHQDETSFGGSLNSNDTPFIVLPGGFADMYGIRPWDVATVIYGDRIEHAVYGDTGPPDKIGEGSIALHRSLGFERIKNKMIINAGIPSGVVTLVYPGSGDGTKQTPEKIRAIGRRLFAALGGSA